MKSNFIKIFDPIRYAYIIMLLMKSVFIKVFDQIRYAYIIMLFVIKRCWLVYEEGRLLDLIDQWLVRHS